MNFRAFGIASFSRTSCYRQRLIHSANRSDLSLGREIGLLLLHFSRNHRESNVSNCTRLANQRQLEFRNWRKRCGRRRCDCTRLSGRKLALCIRSLRSRNRGDLRTSKFCSRGSRKCVSLGLGSRVQRTRTEIHGDAYPVSERNRMPFLSKNCLSAILRSLAEWLPICLICLEDP